MHHNLSLYFNTHKHRSFKLKADAADRSVVTEPLRQSLDSNGTQIPIDNSVSSAPEELSRARVNAAKSVGEYVSFCVKACHISNND